MQEKLIAVCGTTGVGKTKLAIHIAKTVAAASQRSHNGLPNRYSAACLNGDSMQVYKGLDIVTNKPSLEEKSACDHYLFDFVNPKEEYSVGEFRRDALACIKELHGKNTVPVLVGGTNYYIQSLLWKSNLLVGDGETRSGNTSDASEEDFSSSDQREIGLRHKPMPDNEDTCHPSLSGHPLRQQVQEALLKTDLRLFTNEEIKEYCSTAANQASNTNLNDEATAPTSLSFHALLTRIDPVMANKWHPLDFRRIRRSLEIFYTTGKQQSLWYKEQETPSLQFPTLVIWIYGSPQELDARLDARVDDMIDRGLLAELEEMRGDILDGKVVGGSRDINYKRGILQAIGFKEFHEYFVAKETGQSDQVIQKEFHKGVEMMKLATRQYARQQIQWIRNNIVPSMLGEHEKGTGAIYLVDATDPSAVTDEVLEKVSDLVTKFLSISSTIVTNESPTVLAPQLSHLLERSTAAETNWTRFSCNVCTDANTGLPRVFMGQEGWRKHVESRGHKRRTRATMKERPTPGDKEAWLRLQQQQQ